jgi:hypothetical protein
MLTPPCPATFPGRYTLLAAATIQRGQEVTNAYTAPRSNPEMLLGWGFSLPAKAGDWLLAVPLQCGVLPLLPWQAALQAAANVAAECTTQQQPCAALLARLASVAANLPLLLPESIWDDGSSCRAAAAAFAQQLTAPGVQQVYQPLHGSTLQREKVETLFARDLSVCLQQQQQQQQQGQQGAGAAAAAGVRLAAAQQQVQQQQLWCAAALQRSCLIQLAACRTNLEQDAELLRQLQQQEQQQCCPHDSLVHLLPLQRHDQLGTAIQQLLQQLDELQRQLVQTLALSNAYSSLQSMCDATAESAQVVLGALQQQVQQLEQRLGLPPWQGQGRGLKRAAAAVAEHCQEVVPQLLMRQDALLQQLDQLKQQQQQQQLGYQASNAQPRQPGGAGEPGAGEEQRAGPGAALPAGMSQERLAAAVAARLEQKQLLTVGAELCGQVQQVLADARTS